MILINVVDVPILPHRVIHYLIAPEVEPLSPINVIVALRAAGRVLHTIVTLHLPQNIVVTAALGFQKQLILQLLAHSHAIVAEELLLFVVLLVTGSAFQKLRAEGIRHLMVQRSRGYFMLLVHHIDLELVVLHNDLLLKLARKVHSPLEHVRHRLQILVQDDVLAYLCLERVYDELVRRLLLKLQREDLLEYLPQVLRNHFKDLLGVLYRQPLPQEVLELIVLVLEFFVEIAPGQVILVEQVHHDVQAALDVVAARLVVASAGVEAREQEVARKLLDVFFLDVSATVLLVELAREPKIN